MDTKLFRLISIMNKANVKYLYTNQVGTHHFIFPSSFVATLAKVENYDDVYMFMCSNGMKDTTLYRYSEDSLMTLINRMEEYDREYPTTWAQYESSVISLISSCTLQVLTLDEYFLQYKNPILE